MCCFGLIGNFLNAFRCIVSSQIEKREYRNKHCNDKWDKQSKLIGVLSKEISWPPKTNQTFDKKLLIVITDGADNIDATLASGKFLFDDEKFSEFYPAENTFVIDYSNGTSTSFLQRCTSAGCDIYPAENNKQAYLDALDNALQSFKNNWFLVYWTVIIFSLFTFIALLIQPKKIV